MTTAPIRGKIEVTRVCVCTQMVVTWLPVFLHHSFAFCYCQAEPVFAEGLDGGNESRFISSDLSSIETVLHLKTEEEKHRAYPRFGHVVSNTAELRSTVVPNCPIAGHSADDRM